MADGSGPGGEGGAGERDMWLPRYAPFRMGQTEEDNGILREAGSNDVRVFYIGFASRGWMACSACDGSAAVHLKYSPL